MFNPTRDQARRFFFDTWAKYQARQALEGAESLAIEIILAHPEYHGLLERPERYQDQDYPPEFGETNPFLHLSMHLTIAEQVSIDQPSGMRERYEQLLKLHDNVMNAQHDIMDCLAEMIWQAQRQGREYSSAVYFNCLDAKLGKQR
ncbi:MAG: DUF1841 family protein [Thiobacillaceae bacterium]